MTAQVHDRVEFHGDEYSLVGVNGTGLFDPAEHGIVPAGISSACWRGFQCSYGVRVGQLYLDTLNVTPETPGLVLFGIKPERPPDGEVDRFSNVYSNLAYAVAFTGGLLLGRGFHEDLYIHMGFQPAWTYEVVHELLFEHGALQAARDRSEQVGRMRVQMKKKALSPSHDVGDEELMRWIEKTFSLEYEW